METKMTAVWVWWRAMSINEQNALLIKHYPHSDKMNVIASDYSMAELYRQEHGEADNRWQLDRAAAE
jgi:hypothetical protein